jgi:hypothetical protein
MAAVVTYLGGKSGVGFALSGEATGVPQRAEALLRLNEESPGAVHLRGKRVPQEAVARALQNDPFEEYPRAVLGWKRVFEGEGAERGGIGASYWQAVEGFLRRTFHSLTFIPEISFDVRDVSEREERKAFNAALARYRLAKMAGQAALLKELYDGLCALRIVLKDAGQCNLLETVIPVRFLPEILTAAPVWYIEHKGQEKQEKGQLRDTSIRYFCDLCETDAFANLFQIYNRRYRFFPEFSGRDIMPLYIVELIREVRNLFDYLVIATPYHDIASEEWSKDKFHWVRNVDPFLLGFVKQVPELVFFLGRWSGRALFPRIGDMIADTIDHLEKSKALLANESGLSGEWYRADSRIDLQNMVIGPRLRPIENYRVPKECVPRSKLERERWRQENHSLVKFANEVCRQFERGSLFSWLKGESETLVNFR